MDYVAINQPRGVFYNAENAIHGGIHYYAAEKKTMRIKTGQGKTKTIVYIDPEKASKRIAEESKAAQLQEQLAENTNIPKPEIKVQQIKATELADDYHDQEARERMLADRLKEIENKLSVSQEYQYQEQELTVEPNQSETSKVAMGNETYSINIAGTEVSFSDLGITRPYLNREDREWLLKAQHYFIKAKEDGHAIGSAEEYTSMDILEALWATAESVNIDPKRFLVQVYNESRFNPYVKGDAGERGIGQFKKSTALHYGYNWDIMTAGIESYAYQAKAAAEFVRAVGEIAYNGGGKQAEKYQELISSRLENIRKADADCVMSTIAYCSSSDS